MNNSIFKVLNKKACPDGHINFRFLIRKRGEYDFKNSQLCVKDGTYQTPWLLEKVRCLAEYDNKIYLKADEALWQLASDIAGKCKELELLDPGKVPKNLDKENMERMSASYSSRLSAAERRKSEMLIHLAKLKMDIETADTALKHHLERAENVIMMHISSYWCGVLKAAASTDMPAKPDVIIPEIPGKAVYDLHIRNIRKRLDGVFTSESDCTEEV